MRQVYYYPLREISPFKEKYETLSKKTNALAKPYFVNNDVLGFQTIIGKYPFDITELVTLLEKAPSSLVKKIREFDTNFVEDYERLEGLAKELQEIASLYPQKTISNINYFKNLKYLYVESLFIGLSISKEKVEYDFELLADFLNSYKDKQDQNFYIIGVFAEIIKQKMNDKSKAKYFIEKLKRNINNIKYKSIEEKFDFLTSAINSPTGKNIDAIIKLLSLDKTQFDCNKSFFETLIKKDILEFYAFFGLYFAYFMNFDKQWTLTYAQKLLKFHNDNWKIFFEGFLCKNLIYADDYASMNDYYKKAIKTNFNKANTKLSDSLAIFYINEQDKLEENSLISYCFEVANWELLTHIIHCISQELIQDKVGVRKDEEALKEKKVLLKAKHLWDYFWKKSVIRN